MIYADNAATTQMSRAAIDAMVFHMENIWGNPSSLYEFGQKAQEAITSAREKIAKCINAAPAEIYFTSGGSEADNQAIISAAKVGAKKNKKHIISTAFEHHAVLHTLKKLEAEGFEIELLDVHSNGLINPAQVEKAIRPDTCFVTIMFANNEIGTIQPVKELCKIAHDNGALFHTDAVQAVGHIPIDVKNLGVDMLSASAHKFNAPKGIGFLYIRKGVKISPLIDGGSQEFGFRAGTENIAGIVGMAEALKNNCDSLEKNQLHIKQLENLLLDNLNKSKISYVKNGGQNTLPGLISLSFENQNGETILHRLDLMRICISTGAACNGTSTKISHVLQAINLTENLAKGTVRISLGKYNITDDVVAIANAIKKLNFNK